MFVPLATLSNWWKSGGIYAWLFAELFQYMSLNTYLAIGFMFNIYYATAFCYIFHPVATKWLWIGCWVCGFIETSHALDIIDLCQMTIANIYLEAGLLWNHSIDHPWRGVRIAMLYTKPIRTNKIHVLFVHVNCLLMPDLHCLFVNLWKLT